ncbi:MAG: N,N-dimethylformamidase beta subunit family domain-containing protein [Alphaproteobacteria bacterium]
MTTKTIAGYADKISVAPGERIEFKVSCEPGVGDYRAAIVRVVCGDGQPAGPGLKLHHVPSAVDGAHQGRHQPIAIGSWLRVPAGPALARIASFTVQAMIWPTTAAKGWQGLLGWWSEPRECGFGLFIDDHAELLLAIGDGQGKVGLVRSGKKLVDRQWYLVAASYDAASGAAVLIQEPAERFPFVDDRAEVAATVGRNLVGRPDAPFAMAAILTETGGGAVTAGSHFNGKIDRARLANRALKRTEIERLRDDPAAPALAAAVVAAWDFARAMAGDAVTDASPNRLDGVVVNTPTRAVRGWRWNGDAHDWRQRPDHYGAIHFHDDDLDDAGWATDFALEVPANWPSGFYAATLEGGGSEESIPFFVRPPRGRATAPLLLLVPTASYMAYANTREVLDYQAAELQTNTVPALSPELVYLNDHPEVGLSTYDAHNDGSGVAYVSRLRPMLNMRVKGPLWQYNADTHITDWLETKGIAYDVVTDEDLDAEGVGMLERYPAVMTGTHPEYTSTAMLDAIEAYVGRGGRLIYLGANGFYWRVAFHPTRPGIMEMRRAEAGSRSWFAEPGEYHMSFSGELGGLWQRQGRAPQKLVGTGFIAQGFDLSSYYVQRAGARNPRAAWIFDGVGGGEKIGDFGLIGGGAAGWELDYAARRHGTPPHALVLASSEGHTDTYMIVSEEIGHNYPTTLGRDHPDARADMVFFETPRGGAVFSTSSIAWAGALCHAGYANNVSRITENVVRRFLDPKPFPES